LYGSLMNALLRYLPLFALLQVACSSARTSKLYGAWRSDAGATKAYLAKHAKLTDYQKQIFSRLFGKTVITFNPDGSGGIKVEAIALPKRDGGQLNVPASERSFTYSVLGESDSQIVIAMVSGEPLFDDYPFAVLKFHTVDTYSVSLSEGLTDINGREFFNREKSTKSEPGSGGNRRPAAELSYAR